MNLDNFGFDPIMLAGPLDLRLRAVKAAGFSHITVWGRDLAEYPGGYEAAVALVRGSGLRVGAFQVLRDYEGLPVPLHASKLEVAKAMLRMCRDVGAPLLVVCASTQPQTAADAARAADDLRQLANLGVPLGVRIGYKAVAWGNVVHNNTLAWEMVDRVAHANLGLVIDAVHFLAGRTPPESLDDIDPARIALVQLADFAAPLPEDSGARRQIANHARLFPGESVHSAEIAALVRRLDRLGYRGDYHFLVMNDDDRQLPAAFVVDRARRAVKWVTDQALRRSLPIRSGNW